MVWKLHEAKKYADTVGDAQLSLAGGTLTGDVNFNNNKAIQSQIEHYTETIGSATVSGAISLNLASGNIHKDIINGQVDSVAIVGASATAATSLTWQYLVTGEFTFAWMADVAVITDSVAVNVDGSDNSFNSSEAFADNVEPGDLITTTGFDEDGNNGTYRVVSATTSEIVVTSESVHQSKGVDNLITESAGEEVSITRQVLYGDIPDIPNPYVWQVVTLYSFDGDRWYIAEVGEM